MSDALLLRNWRPSNKPEYRFDIICDIRSHHIMQAEYHWIRLSARDSVFSTRLFLTNSCGADVAAALINVRKKKPAKKVLPANRANPSNLSASGGSQAFEGALVGHLQKSEK
jgi:hypothetical protein